MSACRTDRIDRTDKTDKTGRTPISKIVDISKVLKQITRVTVTPRPRTGEWAGPVGGGRGRVNPPLGASKKIVWRISGVGLHA